MTGTDETIALCGTDEPVEPPIMLRAGDLCAEFDGGNLRHIRVGSVEVIRAVSFILRDRHWGTYTPVLSDLEVEQGESGFTLRYAAEVKDATQSFRYRATIEGRPDRIHFAAEGEAPTGFETNRTGFVVLHPVNGVAGGPVTVEHVDGRVERSRFPDLIDPIQPFKDIRALTHAAAPGLTVTCRMEGDAFEMEDQRNWCDASFKTYVRPLSRPWPYRLGPGQRLQQSVTLTIAGQAPAVTTGDGSVRLTLGDPVGTAPPLGLGFDPSEAEATLRVLPRLSELRPAMLVCHFDPRRGHDRRSLEAALTIAEGLGAEAWLEAVIVDVEGYAREIAALGELVRSLGSRFRSVLLTPAADLRSTTPGQPWPPAPPADDFHRAAREAFPTVRLGGGMASSFTELNRKRPPLTHLDFVGFTTMALIHASDDTSVLQGLEALPSIARSAQAIAGSLPLVVGPSAIGLRINPYGAAPLPNPGNRRLPMALNDPRQRARIGAVWALAYYSRLAAAGVKAIVFGGTTGPFGVVHTPQPWPTPGYEGEGTAYPVFDVLCRLSRFAGATLRRVQVSDPALVEAVAVDAGGEQKLLLGNLTPRVQQVRWGDRVATLQPYATVAP